MSLKQTRSFTFVDPIEKIVRREVEITTDNQFKDSENLEVLRRITYYGNFEKEVGCKLRARISPAGCFEIAKVGSDHYVSSDILEIIHPRYGLILVTKEGQGFKIIKLKDLSAQMPLGMLSQEDSTTLALSLSINPDTLNEIQTVERDNCNDCIQVEYGRRNRNRESFHIGLLKFSSQIPQPHYTLIKRAMQEIADRFRGRLIPFSNFFLEQNSRTRTIWLLPPHEQEQICKDINREMRNWLDDFFNPQFGMVYLLDSYTGEEYRPHITLVHGEITSGLSPDLVNQLRECFIEKHLNVKVYIPRYSLPVMDDNNRVLVDLAKVRLLEKPNWEQRFDDFLENNGLLDLTRREP